MGKFEKFMELKEEGGQFGDEEVFKCEECGGQTYPDKGWDGEPDPGSCKRGCSSRHMDFKIRVTNNRYRENFDKVKWGTRRER